MEAVAAGGSSQGPGPRNRNLLQTGADDQVSADNLITQHHSLQLVENLRKIYDEEDCFLYDVTLVSKDKVEVRAHKVILAAQSDFFKVTLALHLTNGIQIDFTCHYSITSCFN